MQEGLAVEPLLLGCGVKPHDLKRLRHQPKQLIMDVINPVKLEILLVAPGRFKRDSLLSPFCSGVG